EIPDMEPVMQLHLRMHFKAADGHAFKTDLFASPMFLGARFELEGLAEPVSGRPNAIALRVDKGGGTSGKTFSTSGENVDGAREVVMEAANGLQFRPKKFAAKPGEALAFRFRNIDVMPHNWVLVKPHAMKSIGEASFTMLNDPDAGRKNYVPASPDVLQIVPVINAESEHILHFRAPEEAGSYPFLCTFPGHWQVMNGVLIVEE
ncbi:MAG: plastocyanin/azurin family copper-binding protein, partial [Verrucomicrobiota bacterium]